MPPFLGGGDMISSVDFDSSRWNDLPWKFEAGTTPYAEATALGVALEWMTEHGLPALEAHEHALTGYLLEQLEGPSGSPRSAPRSSTAARWSRSSSTGATRTTWPRSSPARGSASAPGTTAPSR